MALVARLGPDVVLMDVAMPGMDGIAATVAIRLGGDTSAVVAYSVHDDPIVQGRARAAGAVAFVPKHRTQELLLAALRAAAPRRPE